MTNISTERLLCAYMRLTGRMIWYRPTQDTRSYHPHRRLLLWPPEELPDGLALASLAKHHWLGIEPLSEPPSSLREAYDLTRRHLLEIGNEGERS